MNIGGTEMIDRRIKMEFTKVTTDLPRLSCNVVAIEENGSIIGLNYSAVHQMFNVSDTFSNELAEEMQIKVKAWKYLDEFMQEVKYV